jgi:hypothetical protein
MGLDFDKSDAHWSYSGFHRFRRKLAATIGITLDAMEGFEDPDWLNPGGRRGYSWDKINDPIVPLLYHSDCDGELLPSECASIAPRLRELVSFWDDDDYDKQQAILLADSMDECVLSGTPLIFC